MLRKNMPMNGYPPDFWLSLAVKLASCPFPWSFLTSKTVSDGRKSRIRIPLEVNGYAPDFVLVTSNNSLLPSGLFLPLSVNTVQQERFIDQINASQPLKKQLWQQTVQYKIRNQAAVLKKLHGDTCKNMIVWANSVRSGDIDNKEARAAVYYWKNIFPEIGSFTRDQFGESPNNLLNYGYAILRAIIARSLVSSGMLPTFGIHHHNRYNAYCLADDIMEPYRPFVDMHVYQIIQKNCNYDEITTEIKRELLQIPTIDVFINGKRSPLMVAASATTSSLYKCYRGELRKIIYPEIVI